MQQSWFHITLHKSGSQWVRDLLTHRLILPHTPWGVGGGSRRVSAGRLPHRFESVLYSPCYGVTYDEWVRRSDEGARALVVLRDPRDLVVSMLYSAMFSHTPTTGANAKLMRELLDRLPDEEGRLLIVIQSVFRHGKFFWTWTDAAKNDARVLLIPYERWLADTTDSLARALRHFGVEIDPATLATPVHELAFETRSGRVPGQENLFSHYRRAEPGSWRELFSRPIGKLCEMLQPGLLAALGYESSADWYETLPDQIAHAPELVRAAPPRHELEAARSLTALAEHLRQHGIDDAPEIAELAAAAQAESPFDATYALLRSYALDRLGQAGRLR